MLCSLFYELIPNKYPVEKRKIKSLKYIVRDIHLGNLIHCNLENYPNVI